MEGQPDTLTLHVVERLEKSHPDEKKKLAVVLGCDLGNNSSSSAVAVFSENTSEITKVKLLVPSCPLQCLVNTDKGTDRGKFVLSASINNDMAKNPDLQPLPGVKHLPGRTVHEVPEEVVKNCNAAGVRVVNHEGFAAFQCHETFKGVPTGVTFIVQPVDALQEMLRYIKSSSVETMKMHAPDMVDGGFKLEDIDCHVTATVPKGTPIRAAKQYAIIVKKIFEEKRGPADVAFKVVEVLTPPELFAAITACLTSAKKRTVTYCFDVGHGTVVCDATCTERNAAGILAMLCIRSESGHKGGHEQTTAVCNYLAGAIQMLLPSKNDALLTRVATFLSDKNMSFSARQLLTHSVVKAVKAADVNGSTSVPLRSLLSNDQSLMRMFRVFSEEINANLSLVSVDLMGTKLDIGDIRAALRKSPQVVHIAEMATALKEAVERRSKGRANDAIADEYRFKVFGNGHQCYGVVEAIEKALGPGVARARVDNPGEAIAIAAATYPIFKSGYSGALFSEHVGFVYTRGGTLRVRLLTPPGAFKTPCDLVAGDYEPGSPFATNEVDSQSRMQVQIVTNLPPDVRNDSPFDPNTMSHFTVKVLVRGLGKRKVVNGIPMVIGGELGTDGSLTISINIRGNDVVSTIKHGVLSVGIGNTDAIETVASAAAKDNGAPVIEIPGGMLFTQREDEGELVDDADVDADAAGPSVDAAGPSGAAQATRKKRKPNIDLLKQQTDRRVTRGASSRR